MSIVGLDIRLYVRDALKENAEFLYTPAVVRSLFPKLPYILYLPTTDPDVKTEWIAHIQTCERFGSMRQVICAMIEAGRYLDIAAHETVHDGYLRIVTGHGRASGDLETSVRRSSGSMESGKASGVAKNVPSFELHDACFGGPYMRSIALKNMRSHPKCFIGDEGECYAFRTTPVDDTRPGVASLIMGDCITMAVLKGCRIANWEVARIPSAVEQVYNDLDYSYVNEARNFRGEQSRTPLLIHSNIEAFAAALACIEREDSVFDLPIWSMHWLPTSERPAPSLDADVAKLVIAKLQKLLQESEEQSPYNEEEDEDINQIDLHMSHHFGGTIVEILAVAASKHTRIGHYVEAFNKSVKECSESLSEE